MSKCERTQVREKKLNRRFEVDPYTHTQTHIHTHAHARNTKTHKVKGVSVNVPSHLQTTIINLTDDNSKQKTQISAKIGKLGGTILKRTFFLLYRIN